MIRGAGMAPVTLAMTALALLTVAPAHGRELLTTSNGCAVLTEAKLEEYNAKERTFFSYECFETLGEKQTSCSTLTGGLCIKTSGTSCWYKARACKPSDDEVLDLFDAWNAALATGNPEKVADRYGPNAVLLPTVSNQIRKTRAEIVAYFVDFLKKGPQGVIDAYEIRHLAEGVVQNLGIYTFTFSDYSSVQARYSYTYVRQPNGQWLITEHHSSAMPEDTLKPVLALFDAWNAALATGDPKAVAALYSPTAVLLPTVSDKVRNTPAEIEDYFVTFLKKNPRGVIDKVEGDTPNIRFLASNVAINSGTYVFTLKKADGSGDEKIRARYTYVYKKGKDGRWLIEEHHSSAMPENPKVE